MEKYKARITRADFEEFAEYYNADKKRVSETLEILQKEIKNYNHPVIEVAKKMFNRHFMAKEEKRDTFALEDRDGQNLQKVIYYCADNELLWNVETVTEHYLHVSFSGNILFWDRRFCTMVALPDYDGLSLGEMKGLLGNSQDSDLLPAQMNSLSVNSINEEKSKTLSVQRELEKMKDDICYARTEELKKLDDEICKLQETLRARKAELTKEINEKMEEAKKQIDTLNNQIYMMESEIYVLRSYSGETIELRRVREGKKAAEEVPLVVNQKLMYLDEDLGRIVSIYQGEIAEQYDLFEDAIRFSDEVFESFCPQERSLTFFRLSKNATYNSYNADRRMYETEELLHGKKIGFILRDGECAYMGWMDESWRTNQEGNPVPVTFAENLMYQPGRQQIHDLENDFPALQTDSKNTMLSRVFAMSVVQGILDNRGLITFPEKVKILKPGRYIIYNFATGWIADNRFGDFATLVNNLNKRTKIKDQILICYNKWNCDGRGERNRAHDCKVPEGMNHVNYLESDDYGHCDIYVSARKRYSIKGATANVMVRRNEYINITYMNSIWLSYYVQTKKLGAYCEDYAKMIKHFKRAIEILKDREMQEMVLFRKYYPEADQIPEWEIKLSHWKLNHNIRFINDFQAKRFAKYLSEGRFEENRNLFEKEIFYTNIEATCNGLYVRTNFDYVRKRTWESEGEFAKGSTYDMQNYYIDVPYTNWFLSEEKKEKNALKISEELPKLEASVPDRIQQDERKLELVNSFVEGFMKEHGVSVVDIPECPFGLSFDGGQLRYVKLNELIKQDLAAFFSLLENDSHYPAYIKNSSCWQVAYYDYVHRQYDVILHHVKMVIHNRFMNDRKISEEIGK